MKHFTMQYRGENPLLFSDRDLLRLIIPLLLEQLLSLAVGLFVFRRSQSKFVLHL